MTSSHGYGPHRPEDAPNSVTVLSPSVHSCGWDRGHAPGCVVSSYPRPEVRPIPAELLEQRRQLNELASAAGLEVAAQLLTCTCPNPMATGRTGRRVHRSECPLVVRDCQPEVTTDG